jgi:hypothetical protein
MTSAISDYFGRLASEFGRGWTRFWFIPSDPRVLCAMRPLIGLLVVYLHATLSLDLVSFFGPRGLLPAAEIAPLEASTFSYLNYLSTPGELWTVHLLGLAVLLLFTAGVWTRVSSVLALVVFLSDVNRAPMITSCTESIAAMVMLYLCLAPCGQQYSIDAWRAARARAAEPNALAEAPGATLSTTATIATRLIQLNLALLVGMMAFSQLSGEVWWLGTGTWWLIARSESRLVDLTDLYAWPKLIELWTHAVVLFELAFATLVWVPLARPLLLGVGVVIWSSLALVTGDVPFALAMMIASMAFVSPRLLPACCSEKRPQQVAVALG